MPIGRKSSKRPGSSESMRRSCGCRVGMTRSFPAANDPSRADIGSASALLGPFSAVRASIVLDEPNASLDYTGERMLLDAIEQMKLANVTVVIVTHRMGALAATDKIAIMEGGSVVAFGESEEIFERHLSRPQVASQIETSESSAAVGGAPARSGSP